jgi:hypothetical protein
LKSLKMDSRKMASPVRGARESIMRIPYEGGCDTVWHGGQVFLLSPDSEK